MFFVLNGKLIEFDDRLVLLADIVILDERGGGTENSFAELGGKAKSRILRILILLIGWLMRLVDNNKAKVLNWGKEGRAWTDYDLRFSRFEGFLPDLMTDRFGLAGVQDNDILKMRLKIAHDLRGEGDFRHENNDGLLLCERMLGEFDIDVSFAAASDAV